MRVIFTKRQVKARFTCKHVDALSEQVACFATNCIDTFDVGYFSETRYGFEGR